MHQKLFQFTVIVCFTLCISVLSVLSEENNEKSKINEIYTSSFLRTPRRGYRPEDISNLDETTKAEIEAIRQLCLTYTKSLSEQDFRKAWECYWEGRASYDRFLTFGFIKAFKTREYLKEYWASLKVLDIKISSDIATADLGNINVNNIIIVILIKKENQWKIRTWYSTDSRDFDENKLPSFYFEDDEKK